MRSGTLSGRDPATGDGVCVTWRNGLLTASAPDPEAPDLWLAAGLVDLQINGFAGHDLNAEVLAPETVSAMARAVIATGTTRFLPTLITAPPARIAASLAVIAAARDADPLVARMIPGVHLEGPWISPEDGPRGAHPKAFVTAPDLELFDQWQAGCGGLVRIVTLSPHWPGSVAAIRGLVERGVQVSIGHTGADPAEIAGAAAAGATLCTHLGNGVSAVLARHPNLIWEQLGDDRLTASFIADGHHLPPATFRAMLRAKGLGRAILVSDATALAGQPPGRYEQSIGGEVELSADGCLSLAGTPYLAGAALPLSATIARATAMAGIGLSEAIAMATEVPGRIVGGGRLAIGASADIVRFAFSPGDRDLAIDTVLSGGEPA